jgi:UDP-glucuronate decarboxylase
MQALRGEDLTVYGSGLQTRSFCYVDDLIDGIVALMEHPSFAEPVNLGNPEEFTVLELAEIVRELVDTSSSIVFEALPQDDPKMRKPITQRARELLGFEPKVPLRTGLAQTIAYFETQLGAPELASGPALVGSHRLRPVASVPRRPRYTAAR